MRRTHLWPARALRPERGAAGGRDGGHHAGGLRAVVSGDGRRLVRPVGAWLAGLVPAPGLAHAAAGPVPGGGQHAPGAGRADGGAVGPAGGGQPREGPRFDQAVPRNGYAWWYLDALSDDGRHGLTLIAFIGSVFSPYYARARRAPGGGDPYDHCAVNVALYGPGGRWAMTERGRAGVQASAATLAIGPSTLTWDGAALTVDLDEIAAPIPRRVRGRIRLHPSALTSHTYTLDGAGLHRWRPYAPCARVAVELTHPALRWSGTAYFDANTGDAPLEDAFSAWDWSRAHLHGGTETAVLYEAARRDGDNTSLALRFDAAGNVSTFEPPPRMKLPATRWRVARATRSDTATPAYVDRTLEDTPFYARSVLATGLLGEEVTAVHESLSLDRFRSGWVQALLPFRMPRRRR